MTDWLIWIYAALVGAALGSFVNVCVARWPAGRSVVAPRSACPSCERPIAWYDNIPVLSYLWLRGRCRGCSRPISVQYPLVELAVALVWAGAAVRFGASVEALRVASFLTLLFGIALIDARHQIIPDQFSLVGAGLGLAFAAVPGGFPLADALVGAALAYALMWLVMTAGEKILGKPTLGAGDVHMMAMVGAYLGLAGALLTVFLGSLLGLLIGVPLSWWKGELRVLGTRLPLGTYLALGAALAYLWGDALIGWYLGVVFGG